MSTATTWAASLAKMDMNKRIGQMKQAKAIANTLGMRRAAGYLRNRGWTLEGALWVLLKTEVRHG